MSFSRELIDIELIDTYLREQPNFTSIPGQALLALKGEDPVIFGLKIVCRNLKDSGLLFFNPEKNSLMDF